MGVEFLGSTVTDVHKRIEGNCVQKAALAHVLYELRTRLRCLSASSDTSNTLEFRILL